MKERSHEGSLQRLLLTPNVKELIVRRSRALVGDTTVIAVISYRGQKRYAAGLGYGEDHAANCAIDSVDAVKAEVRRTLKKAKREREGA